MAIGLKGIMNIDFSERYDQEDDTYYVTFKTGEPSYCVELNDILLLEVGLFTKLPTGFRILNYTKSKVKSVKLLRGLVKEIEGTLKKDQPTFQQRRASVEHALDHALDKVLA